MQISIFSIQNLYSNSNDELGTVLLRYLLII